MAHIAVVGVCSGDYPEGFTEQGAMVKIKIE
jgi:hypothetical protein